MSRGYPSMRARHKSPAYSIIQPDIIITTLMAYVPSGNNVIYPHVLSPILNIKMLRIFLILLLSGGYCLCRAAEEKIIILNEGMWQSDNGRLSYFEDEVMISNEWFREVNGYKLGDTPNDIIQVNDDLIAIAINWSNIIQFIRPDGKSIAEVENIPNVRCLATDGEYVYATSYAHECETKNGHLNFEKGYVAKIDTRNFTVISACETGYEPEGIAYYDGKLFIANTGGYAFQEGHDYETSVTVVDADTMEKAGDINTGRINLDGNLSQSGQYLCINSVGDYYEVPGCGIILDCKKAIDDPDDSFATIPYAVTYNCPAGDNEFFAVGAGYSYITGEYEFHCLTVKADEVLKSKGREGYIRKLPGSMEEIIMGMESPYGIYRNPYTGMLYATDAGSYAGSGRLYQWSPQGTLIGQYPTYINPGGFLALPPDSYGAGIDMPGKWDESYAHGDIFNLSGIKVTKPRKGSIYIINGKKIHF